MSVANFENNYVRFANTLPSGKMLGESKTKLSVQILLYIIMHVEINSYIYSRDMRVLRLLITYQCGVQVF